MGVIGVVVVLAASGCLVGEVQGIRCGADAECPTTYFCDLPRSECRAVTDAEGIPSLDIPKVRDPTGALVLLPHVPAGATSPLGLQIVNHGAGPAEGVSLSFAKLECTAFTIHSDSLPDILDAGQSAIVAVDVTTGAGDCAAVKIIDWFLDYSGRESRGTFDLDIKDPTASP